MHDAEVVRYREVTEADRPAVAAQFGPVAECHLCFSRGFTTLAENGGVPVGLIAVQWRRLPKSLRDTSEAFIDIIEVHETYQRQGIGARLVTLAADRDEQHGSVLLRAWSSSDKAAALNLWRQLGFGLCPATTYPGGAPVDRFFVVLRLNTRDAAWMS